MHDDSATPDRPRPRAKAWFRRPTEPDTDSVRIDAEASHSWWAARDEVNAPAVARRRVEERAAAPSPAVAAAARAFAPVDEPVEPAEVTAPREASTAPRATEAWDTASLFQWATSTQVGDDPQPSQGESPWDVLGLSPDASWLEVVRRHRLLVKHLHPDLHGSAELEVKREIERRMADINAAFSDLESVYGISKGA